MRTKRVRQGDETRAVAYLRVSTGRQELGPAAQRIEIAAWAASKHVSIVSWHEDHASGGAEIEDRPALVRALADLRALGAGVLVAANRSRLAREPIVIGILEREARTSGAVLRTADGVSDGTDDDEVSLVRRTVEDMVSKLERIKIRKRTRVALAVKQARNERTGGIPYGRQLAGDGVHLEPHAGEQAVIAAAVGLVAGGLSLAETSAALSARGMVNRAGRSFSKCALHFMLRRADAATAA